MITKILEHPCKREPKELAMLHLHDYVNQTMGRCVVLQLAITGAVANLKHLGGLEQAAHDIVDALNKISGELTEMRGQSGE